MNRRRVTAISATLSISLTSMSGLPDDFGELIQPV
jgi:hypothetical protein